MSLHRSITRIPAIECCREAITYLGASKQIKQKFPWCGIFCKEFCIRDATYDCLRQPESFCRENCKDSCFFIGATPKKS